jgi:hypothetical protein
MAFKDWDDREYYEDDSKCIVCKDDMGKSEALVCSATCEDIWLLKSQQVFGGLLDNQHAEGWENDCYA